MKVFQQLSARCTCEVCGQGCLCGDCAACSNPALDNSMSRNAKTISAVACLAIILGGFVFLAPVVTLGQTPTVTETFSVRVQQSQIATAPMGSISFCLFGEGAVLINGTYYPSAATNQTGNHICSRK
ncbi:MAG TPA: hypothetical protein VLU91_03765 [Nitrososphaerales archaeon]|nr:hypothetical protein [Nitrososphaerales archaeon]